MKGYTPTQKRNGKNVGPTKQPQPKPQTDKHGGKGVAAAKKLATTLAEPVTEERTDRKMDDFPLVSVMEQKDMDAVLKLMSADINLGKQLKALNEQRAENKNALAEILAGYDEVGFKGGVRWGQMAVYYGGMRPGKRTRNNKRLDAKLAESGWTAEEIDATYKRGKPYLDLKVKDLSKGGQDEDEED